MATKQNSAIAGIVLLFIIITGDLIVGVASTHTPSSCPSSPASPCLTKVQSQTTTVTVASGATSGTATFTFSPAYSVVPSLVVNWFPSTTNFITVPLLSSSFFALTSTGQTWTSMPAAQTEIFGDNGQHWIRVDLSAVATAIFSVDCPTASTSITSPILKPQYSLDGGVTWNDLALSAGQLNVIIDGVGSLTGNCGANNIVFSNTTPASIALAAQAAVFLRIVGANGAGVGDNPVFTSANLQFYGSTQACNAGFPTITATAVTFKINCIIKLSTSLQFGFKWVAGIPA